MTAILLALGLGFVSGLRTFTPVAAVMLVRGVIWGIVLAVAAVGEYAMSFASENECDWAREKAEEDEKSSGQLKHALKANEREE